MGDGAGTHQRRGRRARQRLQPHDGPARAGARRARALQRRPRATRRRGHPQHRDALRRDAHDHLDDRARRRAEARRREDHGGARPPAPGAALASARPRARGRRLHDRRRRRTARASSSARAVDLAALCPPPHRATVDAARGASSRRCPSRSRARPDRPRRALPAARLQETSSSGSCSRASIARRVRPTSTSPGALASQAAAALANAGLFETARRHEAELRKLSQVRVQLQEESLRSLSRELHDGVGQVLTAIKMDLGMIERATTIRSARAADARARSPRAGDGAAPGGAHDVAAAAAVDAGRLRPGADAAVAGRRSSRPARASSSTCGRRRRDPPAARRSRCCSTG